MISSIRARVLIAVSALSIFAIAAVACGSDEPASEPTSEPTLAPQPTATPVPPTEEPHDHSSHHHGPVDSPGMSVDLNLYVDEVSGVNVEILPENFTFTPENVNQDHIDGEGHAHVYVDGVKYSRVYNPWFQVRGLAPGEYNIAVTLNANTHADYTSNGLPVIASKTVTVPEPKESHHDHHHGHMEAVEAGNPMSVQVSAEPDSASGANVFLTVEGLTFSPEDVNRDHVDGEGHGHIYVDGKGMGRLYGPSKHLGKLSEGMHEIRVTLNTNKHAPYTVNGEVVEAVTMVQVEKGGDGQMMDDGHGHDHGHGEAMNDDHGHDKMDDGHGHGDGKMDGEAMQDGHDKMDTGHGG